MSKSTINDITGRKLTMILHARNHVDASKDKLLTKPPRDAVTHEEALNAEILVSQALVDILVGKGLISREELLERIEAIRNVR